MAGVSGPARLVCGRRPPRLRTSDPHTGERHALGGAAPSGRPGRGLHAVELPGMDRHAEGRTSIGGRLFGHSEVRRRNAQCGLAHRPGAAGRWPAAPCDQRDLG